MAGNGNFHKHGSDRFSGEGMPLIVGAVVETVADKADDVAERLVRIDGLEVVGRKAGRRIAVVWDTPDGNQIAKQIEELVRSDEEIIGVFPTFAGHNEED